MPNGWVELRLDEVSQISRGASPRPKGDPRYFGGHIPWITIRDINRSEGRLLLETREAVTTEGAARSRLLPPGSLILSNSASVCIPKILKTAGCIHDGFLHIDFNDQVIDREILFEYFRYIRPSVLREHRQGMTQVNLNTEIVSSFKVPIAPLHEQRRIVDKIDSLSAKSKRARDHLNHLSNLEQKYRNSILEAAFEGQLFQDQRSAAFKAYPVRQLGEIIDRVVAGKNMRCEERPPTQRERGVIKVSAVTWGRFDPDAAKTLPDDFLPPEATRIRSGDFLISRANTLQLVGAVAIVDSAPENLFLSDKVLRLEMPHESKEWVLWFLRSPRGRKAIEVSATGNQLSMRNLSQEALRAIQIPWPGRALQTETLTRIRRALSWMERLAAEATNARKLINHLDQAILSKAFRGELVPQDPDDEPASVLLERIKAERTGTIPARRGRGRPRLATAI